MYSFSFLDKIPTTVIALTVFLIMIFFFYCGIRLRKFYEKKQHHVDDKSIGALEGSLLGLLALLLSFTFNMSSSRYERRISVIIEEANNIGTAILRSDLYPDSIRAAFRKDFKAYLQTRIDYFDVGHNLPEIYKALKRSSALQQSLWNRAAALGRDKENLHRTSQMIPALNAMIDIVTTRNATTVAKVPTMILYLLFMLCWVSSFMLGYAVGKKPDWIFMMGFSVTIVMTIYIIIDLDRPRRGIITMEETNNEIVNLMNMFDKNE